MVKGLSSQENFKLLDSAVCIELSLILVHSCDFKFIFKCNFKLDIDDSFHQNI